LWTGSRTTIGCNTHTLQNNTKMYLVKLRW